MKFYPGCPTEAKPLVVLLEIVTILKFIKLDFVIGGIKRHVIHFAQLTTQSFRKHENQPCASTSVNRNFTTLKNDLISISSMYNKANIIVQSFCKEKNVTLLSNVMTMADMTQTKSVIGQAFSFLL